LTSQQKTLQNSREKTRVTLGYTYYDNPDLLNRQLDIWRTYPAGVDIFVVDDGSEVYPAIDILKDYEAETFQPTLQLWKVTRNLGFNSHGCRNLIAKYSTTDSIQFLDLDMMLPAGQIANIKKIIVEEDVVYNHRCYWHSKQRLIEHPGHYNCFLIHKDTYNKNEGYDESFTGHHYGDREFLERMWDNGVSKANTNVIVELHGEPRHGTVSDKVDKTEYVHGEKTFLAPLSIPEVKKLRGTKKQRLDFPFLKML
jgi:hypothetical protein